MDSYISKFSYYDEDFYYDFFNGTFCDTHSNMELTNYTDILKRKSDIKNNLDYMYITLAITNACNLNCTYCFQSHEHNFMGNHTIQKILELIREYKKNHPNIKRLIIVWFGGEPLLNLEFILENTPRLILVAESLGLDYSARVITNGMLLDKINQYVTELRITEIQVTLDGMKNTHDHRRKYKDGKGTFLKIIQNIKNLDKPIDMVLRINVDKDNIIEIFQLYDYLKELFKNTSTNLYIQPMLVEDYNNENTSSLEECKNLLETYLDLLEYTEIIESPNFIGAYCNVDFINSFIVDSYGKISKCWANTNNNTRPIDNVTTFTEDSIETLNREVLREKCYNCEILPSCMGGCLYLNTSDTYCELIKYRKNSIVYREYLKVMSTYQIEYQLLRN